MGLHRLLDGLEEAVVGAYAGRFIRHEIARSLMAARRTSVSGIAEGWSDMQEGRRHCQSSKRSSLSTRHRRLRKSQIPTTKFQRPEPCLITDCNQCSAFSPRYSFGIRHSCFVIPNTRRGGATRHPARFVV
jgi:hypothetical protein